MRHLAVSAVCLLGALAGCERTEAAADVPAAPVDAIADAGATDLGATDLGATDLGATDLGATDAGTDAGPAQCLRPLAIERAEDLGAFSLPPGAALSRDGVSSGAFRGRVVWTFGDTFLTRSNPVDGSSVLSATAGWSTVDAPLALREPTDDAGFPQQLIPYTADELRANRADALNGWALWPGAAIDTGGGELLVLFQRVKRTNGSGFDSMGVGTARLALDATVAVRAPSDLFAGAADAGVPTLYGSGGVSVIDGTAYFFACGTVGFLNQGCRVARVAAARADDRSAFEFYDGTGWVSDISRAAVVIDHVGGGLSITRNPYLGCYLSVTGELLQSGMVLRSSTRLEGGWGAVATGASLRAAAGGPVLPAAADAYDYLFLEHPALRSADGRQIVVSYSRPLGNFRGEVRLVRITLR
jgi:hypothetical protein